MPNLGASQKHWHQRTKCDLAQSFKLPGSVTPEIRRQDKILVDAPAPPPPPPSSKAPNLAPKIPSGYGSKLNHQGTTGFSHCFHLPGCHFGVTLCLTHSQIGSFRQGTGSTSFSAAQSSTRKARGPKLGLGLTGLSRPKSHLRFSRRGIYGCAIHTSH